jgi:hypothetical protein
MLTRYEGQKRVLAPGLSCMLVLLPAEQYEHERYDIKRRRHEHVDQPELAIWTHVGSPLSKLPIGDIPAERMAITPCVNK